jgi:hypothetical protein
MTNSSTGAAFRAFMAWEPRQCWSFAFVELNKTHPQAEYLTILNAGHTLPERQHFLHEKNTLAACPYRQERSCKSVPLPSS